MFFLIDYENVHNSGMRGNEHLLPTDYVIVFYGPASLTMERRHLDYIQEGRRFAGHSLQEPVR